MLRAITSPGTILGCVSCYVLNDRTRVVTVESAVRFLTGIKGSGWSALVALVPEGFSIQPHRLEFLDKRRFRIVGLDAIGFVDLLEHCAANHHDPEIVDRCTTVLGITAAAGRGALEKGLS